MLQQELLTLLPTELRYERIPLADGDNALGPWLAAIGKYVEPPDDTPGLSVILYGCCEEETPPKPTVDDWRRLDDWLAANATAIDLLDAGIARGRLQLNAQLRTSLEPQPIIVPANDLRNFGRLLAIRAQRLCKLGDSTAAVADCMRLLQMSRMVLQGEGFYLDMLVGTALRSCAANAIASVARTDLPPATRHQLETAITAWLPIEDAIASAIRIEIAESALSTLALLPETNDLDELLDAFILGFYNSAEQAAAMAEFNAEIAPDEQLLQRRTELRRRQLRLLLDGHPRPFDKAATTRLLGELALDSINEVRDPQSQEKGWAPRLASKLRRHWRPTEDELLAAAWPHALHPAYELTAFGDDEAAAAERASSVELMGREYASYYVMPTDAQLTRQQKILRKIDNPIGRVVASILASFPGLQMLTDRGRSDQTAAQQALASAAAA
ncbi:hypothetical protein [Lacipirellula sp.]|uniref:hypothetical protein n=1 Tax=Lacipirellula sp. TaxID=2691419 RepID=UPI003D151582